MNTKHNYIALSCLNNDNKLSNTYAIVKQLAKNNASPCVGIDGNSVDVFPWKNEIITKNHNANR